MPDFSQEDIAVLAHQRQLSDKVTALAGDIWSSELPANARLQVALNLAAELIGKITKRFVGDRLQASISEATQSFQADQPAKGEGHQQEQET